MERRRDIIVIGASAGGVEALRALVPGLPADLPAAVFVAVHVSATAPGVLAKILSRAGRLPAVMARDGEPVTPGRIYVARPDFHLALENAKLRVFHGPRENRVRPSIDVLFRSAATYYGPRAIGVLLTGLLDDGTAGLHAIKRAGGLAIVQDPEDALFPDMPRNALQAVAADYTPRLAELSALLARLSRPTGEMQEALAAGAGPIEAHMAENEGLKEGLSYFTCPECGGSLIETQAGGVMQFRCHVGHAFSVQAMLESQADGLEQALWVAVRILEEQAAFSRRLAGRHEGEKPMGSFTHMLHRKAQEAEGHARTIRSILESATDVDVETAEAESVAMEESGSGESRK
jgi:two-component system chemotaxis response regulator CheB